MCVDKCVWVVCIFVYVFLHMYEGQMLTSGIFVEISLLKKGSLDESRAR